MIVIKKDGRQQPFSADKIARSAIGSARDMGIHISDKEAHLLAGDVLKMLQGMRGLDGLTSSYELRGLLGLALKQFGYLSVAQRYVCESLD